MNEISLVYTWVDGGDPHHVQKKHKYLGKKIKIIGDENTDYRFRSSGEIYHSIESSIRFAPWISKIFIVVDDDQIGRFDMGKLSNEAREKITLIKHSEIFTGEHSSHLPTFNSHAIESQLYKIPNLTEHFIYANDDCFFGAPVEPSLFFSPNPPHKLVTIASRARLLTHHSPSYKSSYMWARVNNSRLLRRLMRGQRERIRYEWIHQMRPCKKSYYEQAWAHPMIRPHLIKTSSSRFRSTNDLEPVGFILHWKCDQRETVTGHVSCNTFSINDEVSLTNVFTSIIQKKYPLFCLNDARVIHTQARDMQYKDYLQRLLPHNIDMRLYNALQKHSKYDVRNSKYQHYGIRHSLGLIASSSNGSNRIISR